MRVGWQGREIDDFGNYLGGQMTPFRAATPVVTAIENYALFIWECPAESQQPSEKRRGSSHRDPDDVDL